jgi:hypothetical protein
VVNVLHTLHSQISPNSQLADLNKKPLAADILPCMELYFAPLLQDEL